MKAVILAGGEGTRLRPLSCGTPKPMTSLFDRPVMAHTIDLLKRHGIRDIAVTLCYMPQVFEDYFGDGSRFGVSLSWYREEEPLGTAGGVAACGDFLDSDFLVISGDAVCDFDLAPLFAFHRDKGAEVTVALSRQRDPVGYGLVQTDAAGRVQRFIEKPAWDSVVTDAANTGIYVLSPSVLRDVPAGRKYDFAHDLFPRLLLEGRGVYAAEAAGYWCDIGSNGAYLTCVRDALAGRVKLSLPPAERGIRALSPIPRDAVVTPPVYIGKNVSIAEDAHVGPYAVLGEGTRVYAGAHVLGSVSDGAVIGRGSRVRDSILCRGASIGDGAVLQGGCVVGEKAVIGPASRLHEGILVWPEKSCPPGTDVRFNLTARSALEMPGFDERGVLTGTPDGSLTPEFCTALGMAAAAACSPEARIGLGCENRPVCGMLAGALECGVRAAGARAVRCGGGFAAAASFAARYASFDLCFFVRSDTDGAVAIHAFGADGLPLPPDTVRRIESALRQGDLPRTSGDRTGQVLKLSGLMDVYCRAAARYGGARGRIYAVRNSDAAPALCNTLWLMGARIAPRADGRALFVPSADGFSLSAADENGEMLDDAHTTACAVWTALSDSGAAALPFDAPAAFDEMAEAFGGRICRLGRDGETARRLRAEQRFLWDAVHRAARLAAFTAEQGISLAELAEKVPRFYRTSREIPLSSDRARFMRAASAALGPDRAEYGRGLRIRTGGGWITISPLSRSCAVRLWAESGSAMEAARELCDGVAERLQQLDRDIKRRKML